MEEAQTSASECPNTSTWCIYIYINMYILYYCVYLYIYIYINSEITNHQNDASTCRCWLNHTWPVFHKTNGKKQERDFEFQTPMIRHLPSKTRIVQPKFLPAAVVHRDVLTRLLVPLHRGTRSAGWGTALVGQLVPGRGCGILGGAMELKKGRGWVTKIHTLKMDGKWMENSKWMVWERSIPSVWSIGASFWTCVHFPRVRIGDSRCRNHGLTKGFTKEFYNYEVIRSRTYPTIQPLVSHGFPHWQKLSTFLYWLVVSTPWKIWVNWDDYPNMWKKQIQTTSQYIFKPINHYQLLYIYIYIHIYS